MWTTLLLLLTALLSVPATAQQANCSRFGEFNATNNAFGAAVPVLECSRAFDCATSYCACVGGNFSIVSDTLECTGTSTTEQNASNCAAERSMCLLLAGLASYSDRNVCGQWGRSVRSAYAQWATGQPSILENSCAASACHLVSHTLNQPMLSEGTLMSIAADCTFIRALNATMPNVAATCNDDYNVMLLPNSAPAATCTDVGNCAHDLCVCLSGSNVSCSSPQNADQLAFNDATWSSCVPQYTSCLTLVAVQTTQVAVEMGFGFTKMFLPIPCLQWSLLVARDYSVRLYAPLASGATNINAIQHERTVCTSTACALLGNRSFNATFAAVTAVAQSAVCNVINATVTGEELPFPFTENACPPVPGAGSPFAAMFNETSSLRSCPMFVSYNKTMCSCLTDNTSTTCDLVAHRRNASIQWSHCVSLAASTLINDADRLLNNQSVECSSWADQVLTMYGDWYRASNRADTQLNTECKAFSCRFLGHFRPLALLDDTATSQLCAFANVTVVPRASPCLNYTCPDNTCALTLRGCACTVNASLSDASIVYTGAANSITTGQNITYGTDLIARASAIYRIPQGSPCGNFDLSSSLRFNWSLVQVDPQNPATVQATVVTSNATTLITSASTFQRSARYNLTLWIGTFSPSTDRTLKASFTVIDPIPIVSITISGTSRRVSSYGFMIPALVQDPFLDASLASWWCSNVTSTACPSSLTTVLLTANVSGFTVTDFVPAGTWDVTLVYKGVSSTLRLVVVTMTIPTAQILISGRPIYSSNYFLRSQTISVAAATSQTSSVAYLWQVNGVSVGSTVSMRIAGSTLLLSTTGNLVPNVITLRVMDTTNPENYGEAITIIYAAVNPTLQIVNVSNRFIPASASATALVDALSIQIASTAVNNTAVLFGQSPIFQLSYFAAVGGAVNKIVMFSTTIGVDTVGGILTRAVPETPMPGPSSAATTSVIFTVDLLINNVLVASANRSFSIAFPPVSNAVASQTSLLAAATDPITASTTVFNLVALIQVSNNASLVTSTATTLLGTMTTLITPSATIPAETQSLYLVALGPIVVSTGASSSTTVATQIVSVVEVFLGSSFFNGADLGQLVINVLGNLPVAQTTAATNTLALRLVEATDVGESIVFTSGKLTVAARQDPASNFANAVLRTGSAELAIPDDFVFPGASVSSSSRAAIATTQADDNPFSASTPSPLTSQVVNFRIFVDNSVRTISDLTTPLVFVLKTANPQAGCWFYNTATLLWSQEGVTVVGVSGDEITCATSHLTSFGAFASSAALTPVHFMMTVLVAVALLVHW